MYYLGVMQWVIGKLYVYFLRHFGTTNSSSAHGSSSSLWVCLVRKPLSLPLHPGLAKENLLVLFVLTLIVRIFIISNSPRRQPIESVVMTESELRELTSISCICPP